MDSKMFQDVLKEARNKLGLKQNEVAELVGVTPQTYLKWENGKSEPKISQAGKLAKALKVSEKELCQGEFHKQKMEPLEFIRKVEILLKHVPHAEFLIGIQDYIHDEDGFIDMLKSASEYPYEIFDLEAVNHAEWMISLAEDGSIKFQDEKQKQAFIDHQQKIIKQKSS